MSRSELIRIARHNYEHASAGTIDQAPEVATVPASHYTDEEHFQRELKQIFHRLPLMLATTAELPSAGDYKALNAAGVPVLISRGDDGEVRAFINACRHRGAQIMPEGRGSSHRFTCPYHAWSYDQSGDLTGIYLPKDFGEIDRSCYSLKALPCLERAGLIWVTLDPTSTLPIEAFLSGYDQLLASFGFEHWHHFSSREVAGPNWKIAYDGYLDFYHLPILHKETFGSDMQNQANYYAYGPHQRLTAPNQGLRDLLNTPEAEWPVERLLDGVWTIFPHISIASFDGGGRSVMLSQLFPGATAGQSVTVQHYLMEHAPDEAQIEAANAQFAFLEHVVRDEDYATGLRQQQALRTGALDHVLFGRNERGGQNFHRWVEQLLGANDAALLDLFKQSPENAGDRSAASAG
ncbi:MAG: aromatic ring-hydroxylating dioxygenase subunit alpha [Pseudomonadota bacterium]